MYREKITESIVIKNSNDRGGVCVAQGSGAGACEVWSVLAARGGRGGAARGFPHHQHPHGGVSGLQCHLALPPQQQGNQTNSRPT